MSKKNPKKTRPWTHTTPAAIATWKEQQHLSWGRVAELLGVAVETIRMWRKGQTVPSASMQQTIASVMSRQAAPAAPPAEAPKATPVEVARDAERKIEKTQSGRLTISLMAMDQMTAEDIARIVLEALNAANVRGVAVVSAA